MSNFCFPSGHVDEGEDFYTTALRETQEEAGFTEKDLKIHKHLKKTLTYNVNNKLKVVVYWLAELISDRDPTLSEEHTEFKYLKMSEIPDFSPFPDFNDMACWFEKEIKKLHADGSY